jgi:hypothetical protein
MSRIIATLGRKLWFYPCPVAVDGATVTMDSETPFDATVIFAWPVGSDGKTQLVNLFVIDHIGTQSVRTSVPLIQEDDPKPATGGYAQWAPYQVVRSDKSISATLTPDASASALPPAVPAVGATPESLVAFALTNRAIPPQDTTNLTPGLVAGGQVAPTAEAFASNFGGALSALKSGKKVARAGWPTNVFVYYVPAANYPAQTGVAKATFGENAMVPYMAYLAIKRADGQVCMFSPGMDSILADDWSVVS